MKQGILPVFKIRQAMKIGLILLIIGCFNLSAANDAAAVAGVSSTQQSEKTVKGKVLDEVGEGLPGASINIKGTTRGVTTDLDGSYTINVKPTDELEFNFLGYQTLTITVGNQTEIIAKMQPKTNELDEVTVVAFAKQKKESVLASITTVKPAELKIPSSNLTTSLAGRMSGLISYQRSGEPGEDNASFFIRGVTSFSYARGPLILIDGVEMSTNDLARLQPDDIASFSIMKDAAATALYGARGGNGVIMVTTKEGQEGKASISFRVETSLSSPTRNIELADPVTYMKLNNEAVLTRNIMNAAPYSLEKIEMTEKGGNPMVYPANDWYNILFKNEAINYRANFNVSGGGKVARYYIAGTYSQDRGVVKTAPGSDNDIDLKKYLLRTNVNINVTPTTEAVVRLHGTFDDYGGPLDSGSDLFSKAMRSDPVSFPPYYIPDEANQYKKHILFGNMDRGQYINPYADMVKGFKTYSKSLMLAQFEMKQKLDFITEGLNARALFTTNRYSFFDVRRYYKPYYYTINSYDKLTDVYTLTCLNPTTGSEVLGYKEESKEITTTTYFEAAVNYDRTFAEKHGVSGLLVANVRNYQKGNAGDLIKSLPSRNIGLSGRFTYNYDSRYFTELNFGYNGSERFSKDHRWGFFPSAGLGWIVSNEGFWNEDLKRTISKLKLKATYGKVGNDDIGDDSQRFFYQSDVNINNADRRYIWGYSNNKSVNGVSIGRYSNDLISWEVSEKLNLGAELTLFREFDLQVDVYQEDKSSILMQRNSIPGTMGFLSTNTPYVNIGEAMGKGIDLSLDWNHNFSKDFWVTGRGNFTYAKAEYTVYEEPDYKDTPWLSRIGTAVSQKFGYVAERLFVDDQDVANSPKQELGGVVRGGDIKYKDINGDDQITDADMVPIGYPTTPEIIYGFGLSAGYKGIDFSFFFQGLARESFWIDARKTSPFIDTDDGAKDIDNNDITSKNALLKAYADNHWSEDNRDVKALWPRLSDVEMKNNTATSTWFMRDGAFLRLKSVELGYKIPDHLTRKMHMTNLRIYASGTNLLTFSKFKLWDPEMAGNGMAYPVQRVFNLGLQLSF